MLNLAVQFMPQVISETFTLSLFTAVVLKLVLEGVVALKDRIKAGFKAATTPVGRVGAGLLLWGLLISSKFVVLELIGILFRDSVLPKVQYRVVPRSFRWFLKLLPQRFPKRPFR